MTESEITVCGESQSAASEKKDVVEVVTEMKYSDEESFNAGDFLGPHPTIEEYTTLRRVAGPVKTAAFTLCAVEFAERASYYGCSIVFANFIQFPLPQDGNGAGAPPRGTGETAGALGKGHQVSTALVLLFQALSYCIATLGGLVADTKWGRYKTICIGVGICGIAHIVLVGGALPAVLQGGHGMVPFIISMLILGFGAGLIKSNICPMVIDQVAFKKPYVKTLRSGERVIVDPESTVQRITLTFYALVNVGTLPGIVTAYCEKRVGYWLAYLVPGIIYFLIPILLAFAYKSAVKAPPQGNILGQVHQVLGVAIRKNGFRHFGTNAHLDVAKPLNLAAQGVSTIKGKPITWTAGLVDDIHRTLVACQIFLFFPAYLLNDGGIASIQTSQASSMTTKGTPNDLLMNFSPLTIIVASPMLNYVVYPWLRKHRILFGPVKRITFGFILGALSATIGAILQWRIYETSPCGYHATECEIGSGVSPLSVWLQVPMRMLSGLSELFAIVTAYELAYARSPERMRGTVMAIFLSMSSISGAIGQLCIPALVDPHLIWPFVGTAVPGFLLTIVFYWKYRDLDTEEFLRSDSDS